MQIKKNSINNKTKSDIATVIWLLLLNFCEILQNSEWNYDVFLNFLWLWKFAKLRTKFKITTWKEKKKDPEKGLKKKKNTPQNEKHLKNFKEYNIYTEKN